jgi:hypothetical protein
VKFSVGFQAFHAVGPGIAGLTSAVGDSLQYKAVESICQWIGHHDRRETRWFLCSFSEYEVYGESSKRFS